MREEIVFISGIIFGVLCGIIAVNIYAKSHPYYPDTITVEGNSYSVIGPNYIKSPTPSEAYGPWPPNTTFNEFGYVISQREGTELFHGNIRIIDDNESE